MTRGAFLDLPPAPDAGLFGIDFDLRQHKVVVIGVPWEPTASYGRGTSLTPSRIIPASHQLDLFDFNIGKNFGACVGMSPLRQSWIDLNARCTRLAQAVIDNGGTAEGPLIENLESVNAASEQLNREVFEETCQLLKSGKRVGIVGGDHSSPYGAILAHYDMNPRMGILHIDAHHDLRVAYEGFWHSHASLMYNLLHEIPGLNGLISVGVRDFSEQEYQIARDHPSIRTFYDRDLKARRFQGESWNAICTDIISKLPRQVYVTFDVDGLNPFYCPHTGTPVPGGLDYCEAVYLLEAIQRSGRCIIGFDVCEAAPDANDSKAEWDMNVAARLLHKLTCLTYLS